MALAIRLCIAAAVGVLSIGCSSGTASARSVSALADPPADGRLATATDQFFRSDEVTIRYRTFGRGQPLVLLHGYAGDLGWPSSADSLAADHTIIVLDLRGFGESSKFADPARYGPLMANDVIRLMDHLGVERAHLLGHSMGAMLAAHLAQHHPERVATVTLVGGALWPDRGAAERAIAPWIAGIESGKRLRPLFGEVYPMWSDSLVHEISDFRMARNDSTALVAVLRSLPTLVPTPGLGSDVPAAVVVGTADPLLQLSRDLAAWWPGVRLIEVEGATHGSVLTHPALLEAVRDLARSYRVGMEGSRKVWD